jgi:hypothetical protein
MGTAARLLLATLGAVLWLFFASGWAFSQPAMTHEGAFDNNFSGSVSVNVSSNNGDVVYALGYSPGGTVSLTTACGTWLSRASTGAPYQIFYLSTPTGLSACSFTANGTAGSIAFVYVSYSNVNAVIFDTGITSALFNSGANAPVLGAAVTTKQSHDIVITGSAFIGTTSPACNLALNFNGAANTFTQSGNAFQNVPIPNYTLNLNGYQTTATISAGIFSTANSGACGSNQPPTYSTTIDAMTSDTPVTGRPRLLQ